MTANKSAYVDESGWVSCARRVESPNHGPRPPGVEIDLLVLHSISLPPGQYGGQEVEALFTNTLDWDAHPYFKTIEGLEVSAHFYIRRSGGLVQFVSTRQRAWHAGVSHWMGKSQCNDYSIGIELEGLEGDRFTPLQYDTLIHLCAGLRSAHPLRHIAGHEHIAPGRKLDPGPGFDWRKLQLALGRENWSFPNSD